MFISCYKLTINGRKFVIRYVWKRAKEREKREREEKENKNEIMSNGMQRFLSYHPIIDWITKSWIITLWIFEKVSNESDEY